MNLTLKTTIVGAAAFAALTLAPAAAQTSPFRGDLPMQDGPALLVATTSVTPADLDDSLAADGCFAHLIGVTDAGKWLIYVPGAPAIVNAAFPSNFTDGTPFIVECNAERSENDAVRVIEEYIADLDAHDYASAYAAWEPGANEQSYMDFVLGYQHTVSVSVDIDAPGPVSAGAGQRYIEIPVVVHAVLDDGTHQTFTGTYTLHHTANIQGTTPAQRAWRIQSGDLVQTN